MVSEKQLVATGCGYLSLEVTFDESIDWSESGCTQFVGLGCFSAGPFQRCIRVRVTHVCCCSLFRVCPVVSTFVLRLSWFDFFGFKIFYSSFSFCFGCKKILFDFFYFECKSFLVKFFKFVFWNFFFQIFLVKIFPVPQFFSLKSFLKIFITKRQKNY